MTRWCLVVEDEPTLGQMICDNLAFEEYGVELVRDGNEAAARIARGGIDLVILDVMLPGKDGFEVLAEMRARGDSTPVLVLSARGEDADRIRGLELRADDYLVKPFNLRELLLRVSALLRRRAPVAAGRDVIAFDGNEIDFRARTGTAWNGEVFELTDTEVRMLRLLTGRCGTVVPRRDAVDIVLGPATPVTTRTLDNVMARLRKLMERDSHAPQWFHTVRGVGWRFDGELDPR